MAARGTEEESCKVTTALMQSTSLSAQISPTAIARLPQASSRGRLCQSSKKLRHQNGAGVLLCSVLRILPSVNTLREFAREDTERRRTMATHRATNPANRARRNEGVRQTRDVMHFRQPTGLSAPARSPTAFSRDRLTRCEAAENGVGGLVCALTL